MQSLTRAYDNVLTGMAILSGLLLLWMMVSIIVSVTMRNLGLQPFAWLFTSLEYGLLYMTMLGAPWLVREKGHVHIELFTASLSPAGQRVVSRLVAVLCVLVCVVLAWKGVELVAKNFTRNDFDVRAYYTPKWMLTLAFPISFGVMALEFGRFVFGPRMLLSGQAGIHE
ncbi:TRAP transporter small permease [Yangia mangrovi]|uniref:TRAP transporter small permease protein n=1 Tax=Alloyangia mangrovi TaxID=1779329 RepID=A0A2A3JSB4_9RHOB|nr:TRAP transporter small permease [Alloyangia mangrovi]MCA0939582.1 TRAP transporter small permease [Alloyangia pacifica]MCA0943373.1 TRAP transporter small permease [Alloyangia pacifica]MCT4370748.1 TRAP transporter small permease [Alloyangia mangrovi]